MWLTLLISEIISVQGHQIHIGPPSLRLFTSMYLTEKTVCFLSWRCSVSCKFMFHTDVSGKVTACAFPSQFSTMELVLLELHFWNGWPAHSALNTAKMRISQTNSLLFNCNLDLIAPACIYHYSMLGFFSRHICHLSFQFGAYPVLVKSGIQSLHSLLILILCWRRRSIHLSHKHSPLWLLSEYCFSLNT